MAALKTQRNEGDVDAFIDSVEDDTRRRDARTIKTKMAEISGEEPTMWGDSIVGYGTYSYERGGNTNQWFKVGFSPRKQYLTLYLTYGFEEDEELLGRLGPHSIGKACLYIKDLEQVDEVVVDELIARSLAKIDAAAGEGFEGTMPA